MNYIELHIRDFIADTQGLSQSEIGAYFLLLLEYYRKGEPLPNDMVKLCNIAKAGTQKERQALASVVSQYFTIQDGFLHNARADEEIEKYNRKQQANIRNGKLGGRPKNPKITERFSADNPKETHDESETKGHQTPDTSHQTPVTSERPSPSVQEVLDYFHKIGHPADEAEAQNFISNYAAVNWMSGATPIRDWRQKANQWKLKAASMKPNGKQRTITTEEQHAKGF